LSDCKSIAQTLKENQTIYGFHFASNYGYVNYNGYLIVPEYAEEEEVNNYLKYEKKIDSYIFAFPLSNRCFSCLHFGSTEKKI